ncbi:hypothetical protein [Frisingicoccus sp.]|uniref:hypothetical protein n=1 Tax=Frisingicoccus sp. TaxID=1918627 RepID=UPI0039926FE7
MIDLKKMVKRYYNSHFGEYPQCEGCGVKISESDVSDVEYVRTKRKTEMFIHKACVSRVWHG